MPAGVPASLCVRCKGYKRLCGLPRCPILERFQAQVSSLHRLASAEELSGLTPPSVVVGEHGYPTVRVYYAIPPTSEPGDARYRDAPREWASRGEPLHRIISLRASTPHAGLKARVDEPLRLYELEISPAALSTRPVDSEARLARPLKPRLRFDGLIKPVGPSEDAVRVRVTSNPSMHPALEKLYWDDVKAEKAVWTLWRAGLDVYEIERAFSLGALGTLKRRRLVPTRWAITAVDDILSRRLRRELAGRPWLDRVEAYRASYLGNRFTVILYPGAGRFEWVEVWHPRGLWSRASARPVVVRVVEDERGRASAVDGGFSAARLAVLEALARRGARADVLILREVLPDYYAPVGNWHIRETVRKAMASKPVVFQDLREAVGYALSTLSAGAEEAARASPLLRGLSTRRLTEYL